MQKTFKTLALLLLPFVFSAAAQGAGYALYEFSARSTAMGGATMANGAEPASLAVNPALITELEGTQVQLGLTAVTANAKTTVAGQSRELKDDLWLLPSFYITHKWSDDITFGLGGFSRYGLGGEYDHSGDWIGSALAYKVKLETFSFTPTLAVKVNEEFSVAMGLEAMVISFTQDSLGIHPLTHTVNPALDYELSGSGVSWGGNFAISYKPQWAEKWAFGAMYRSKVKQTLNGRVSKGPWDGSANNLFAADAKGSISLPDSVSAGLSFRPTDNWVIEGGIVGTFWSAYDQILIEYKDMESTPTIHNQKDYKDAYRLNLGTEYWVNNNWAVRAGYVYDKSPINKHLMDTLVPVDDRHIANIGVGYKTGSWTVDVSYSHIFSNPLEGTSNKQFGSLPMRYSQGKSDIYGLTVGYKF